MIKTLHGYLSRELLKVTGQAMAALTLLLSVFAVIEPLRKFSLAAGQVLSLFGYTLPGMVSLTLPIAALFAATIVYGRFSQDNELTACRASGISSLTLMKPALMLGAVITIISLTLNNYITPKMIGLAERSIMENARDLAYRRIHDHGHVSIEKALIHADRVNRDSDMLEGVIALQKRKGGEVRVLVTKSALAEFKITSESTYVTLYMVHPVGIEVGIDPPTFTMAHGDSLTTPPYEIQNRIKDEPAWYDWASLIETLRRPERNAEIRKDLLIALRHIRHELLSKEIFKAITAGNVYKLSDGKWQYVIGAPVARLQPDGSVGLLSGTGADGQKRQVEVRRIRNQKVTQRIYADAGVVKAAWSDLSNVSQVGIKLTGNLSAREAGEPNAEPLHRDEWAVGSILLPSSVISDADNINLSDLRLNPEKFTTNAAALDKIKGLKIAKLESKIIAEMHTRIAYSLSCFLLVAMGAALGLIFRGGQFISAFALAAMPGTLIIIMLLVGKQIIRNPDVPTSLGLAAIWGGIVAMLMANICVFGYLRRK